MSRALFGTYTKIDFFSFYLSEILNEVGTLCFYLLNLATLLDLNHVAWKLGLILGVHSQASKP